jgi:spore coat protein JB
MNTDRLNMLKNIQKVEFACIDLNLYLDTHPSDQKALMDYNTYTLQLNTLKRQYENIYGPLANFGSSPSQYPWRWIEDPWPWEIEY